MSKKKISFKLLIIIFLGILGSCGEPTESASIDTSALFLPDLNSLFENYDRVERNKQYSAFANELVAANRDLQSSELFLEAASLYHQAGKLDSVVPLLHKAIDKGMANPVILKRFPDLKHYDSALLTQLIKRLDSISFKLKEIPHFTLEMEAMNSFWPYFEKARSNPKKAKQFFKEYIFKGPQEIRDYYAVRYYSLENMYGQMINASPKYYSYLKKQFNQDSTLALKNTTTKWMKKFNEMYPEAVFPKVYIVPGMLNSGGTVTEMGLFVGGDMYGRSTHMPLEELSEWQKDAIMDISALPGLIMHELMHFQQNYDDPEHENMVIYKLIEEGVCDFVVELSSGITLQSEQLSYLEDPLNFEKIAKELHKELFTEDLSKWMYNGGSIEDRPPDLGYALGYLISKSYYKNANDPQVALFELLNTKDMIAILKESEYAYLLDEKSDS